MHEEWIVAGRRYFSEGSMAKLYPGGDDDDTISASIPHQFPDATTSGFEPQPRAHSTRRRVRRVRASGGKWCLRKCLHDRHLDRSR